MIWFFLAGMIAGGVGVLLLLEAIAKRVRIEHGNNECTTGNPNDLD